MRKVNYPRFNNSAPKPNSKAQKRKMERTAEMPKSEQVVCKKCGVGSGTLYRSTDKSGKKIYLCEYHNR